MKIKVETRGNIRKVTYDIVARKIIVDPVILSLNTDAIFFVFMVSIGTVFGQKLMKCNNDIFKRDKWALDCLFDLRGKEVNLSDFYCDICMALDHTEFNKKLCDKIYKYLKSCRN